MSLPLASSKKTLLQIIQDACNELGLQAPSYVTSNSDPQIVQMLALANREGKELYEKPNKNGGWQELRKEYTFNTVGIAAQNGDYTDGSPIISGLSDTTGVVAGMVAVGGYIPVGSVVVSVDSSTQVTLDQNATATASQSTIHFGTQAYSLPDDFAYFMTQTFWDRAFRWQLLGPLEAQEWQVLKSGISPTGPRRRFRVMSNMFYIDPVPASSDNVEVFEYYSNAWVQGSTGTAKTQFTADDDLNLLDDDCITMGVKWRYLAAKRLDYSVEKAEYDLRIERVMARNGGTRNLPLNASASGIRLLNQQNVPDSGYGS